MYSLRDTIHDFVKFDKLEWRIVNSSPVQRLRFLRQLGWTYLVFPGAEHSSFVHAIGSMEIAGKMFDILWEKSEYFRDTAQTDDRTAARLITLLSKLDSRPFISTELPIQSLKALEDPAVVDLFTQENAPHVYNRLLACLSGDKTNQLPWDLTLGSPLTPTKMDALLRDSLCCGVDYGKYDVERLLDTLTIIEEQGKISVGLEEGGLHAFEAFALADYYMTNQIYTNSKIIAFGLHYERWLKEEGIWNLWHNKDSSDYDDLDVWDQLRYSTNAHARAISMRQPYRLAFESNSSISPRTQASFLDLAAHLTDKFGGDQILSQKAAQSKSDHNVTIAMNSGRYATAGELSPFLTSLATWHKCYIFCARGLLEETHKEISAIW